MARMMHRQIRWDIERWDRCVRTWSGSRDSIRRPVWREQCRTMSTLPSPLLAADGCEIPFPRDVRRSEAYRNASEIIADIWLYIPDDADAEPHIDGEIDPAELSDYDYEVLIQVRRESTWLPFSCTDLISHPRAGVHATGAGVAASVATPSSMGGETHFSEVLPNGRTVRYSVLWPDSDGSW